MDKTLKLLPVLFLIYWGCEDTEKEDNIPTEVTLWGVDYSIENTTELDLSNSGLSGEIPPEIGNLINLTYLWLRDNELTGSIPSEIGNLINLTSLGLYDNQFSGSIPPEVGNLTYLSWLRVDNNELIGSIPPEIYSLTNLDILRLNDNLLTGTIPESICDLNINWSNTHDLNISYNQLCPPYPSCIEDYVGEQDTSDCD